MSTVMGLIADGRLVVRAAAAATSVPPDRSTDRATRSRLTIRRRGRQLRVPCRQIWAKREDCNSGIAFGGNKVRKLGAKDTAAKIGVERDLRPDEITIVDGYNANRYGIPDEQTIDAIRTCARLEGMITDPVYEGKSMAGLIGMIRSGEIPAGSRVLYAHLGGQLCLSAYAGVL